MTTMRNVTLKTTKRQIFPLSLSPRVIGAGSGCPTSACDLRPAIEPLFFFSPSLGLPPHPHESRRPESDCDDVAKMTKARHNTVISAKHAMPSAAYAWRWHTSLSGRWKLVDRSAVVELYEDRRVVVPRCLDAVQREERRDRHSDLDVQVVDPARRRGCASL